MSGLWAILWIVGYRVMRPWSLGSVKPGVLAWWLGFWGAVFVVLVLMAARNIVVALTRRGRD